MATVFAHLVLYNSLEQHGEACIAAALGALLEQF